MSCRCGDIHINYDGLESEYSCNNCHRVFTERESLVAATSSNEKLRTSRTRSKKKSPEPEEGHNWSLYEALNFILASMTKQLIECCDIPELKPVVHAVWMEALARIKKSSPSKENDADKVHRKREKGSQSDDEEDDTDGYTGIIFDRATPKKRCVRTGGRKTRLVDTPNEFLNADQKRLKKSKIRNALLQEAQSGRPKSKPVPKEAKKTTSRRARLNENLLRCIPDADEETIERLKLSRTCVRDPEYVTLPKLICYLYCGLLLSQQLIGLPDLIRWIREEYIVYFNAHRVLPDTMKTSDRDTITLGSVSKLTLPSCEYLRENTGKILQYIHISEIYLPPAHLLAEKLIRDLQLPLELVDCIRNIEVTVFKTDQWRKVTVRGKVPNPDAYSASLLLIALKSLLGLDGVSEMNISRFAGKVNQVLGQKRQFDWCAWVRYTEYKMEMLKRYHVPTAINNKAIARVDVDYLKDFSKKRPLLDNDKTRKKPLNEEVRKGVEQILDEMVEQCALTDSGKEMPVFKPSLFATHSLVQELIRSDPVKFRLLENDFPDSTFQCVVDPESLASEIRQADPSVVMKTCPDCDESSLIRWKINQAFYGSWKAGAGQVDSSDHPLEKPVIKCPVHGSKKRDDDKVHLQVPSHDYWTRAAMYLERSSTDDWVMISSKLPGSFLWLLNLVAKNIEEQPKILYGVLSSLESVIMPRHANVLHTWNKEHLKMRYNSAQKTELNRAYFDN